MEIVLKSEDLNEILHKEDRMHNTHFNEVILEDAFKINYKEIKGSFNHIAIDGIRVDTGLVHLPANLNMQVESNFTGLEMCFVLHGNSSFDTGKKNVSMRANEQNIVSYVPVNATLQLEKSECYSFFEINFSPLYVQKLAHNGEALFEPIIKIMESGTMGSFDKHNRPITNAMRLIIKDIQECKYSGVLKRLYVESKTLELLTLQLESFGEVLNKKLSKQEVEKLHYVQHLIDSHIDNLYSISQLSEMVGMCDSKLKRGFKSLFGNTVFGYSTDVRMENAKILIMDGNYAITEVSEMVGYKNPQHFTVAFKKKFGFLPKDLKK